MRTARSRSSGESLLGRAMGSILSRNEPPDEPGTIQGYLAGDKRTRASLREVAVSLAEFRRGGIAEMDRLHRRECLRRSAASLSRSWPRDERKTGNMLGCAALSGF